MFPAAREGEMVDLVAINGVLTAFRTLSDTILPIIKSGRKPGSAE
jgi:hypothetical protein